MPVALPAIDSPCFQPHPERENPMNFMHDNKPFPIPVVAELGIGTHQEDESLDYLSMPKDMATYRAPVLPEPEEIAGHEPVKTVLKAVLAALQQITTEGAAPEQTQRISLNGLAAADLTLVNQMLGEGEVSAQVRLEDEEPTVRIQESVFAGVWRVIETLDDGALRDCIEVGAVPAVLRDTSLEDGSAGVTVPLAPGLSPMGSNAPSVLFELEDQRRRWQPSHAPHVVNLSLLPLTVDDIGYMDLRLGTGRVLILSRGYGNCRITNCCVPHTWRVVYYNSQDTVILNAVEVTDMPDVACAAQEDLRDSMERLQEVIEWVDQS
jgi:hydrogenase-1 operon protein HyaF